MRYSIFFVMSSIIFSMIALSNTNATEYVDTKGNAITEASIGRYCRPMETLENGKVMVFSKSKSDLQMYEQRLIANGVVDSDERSLMVLAASSDDCERKAGNKCKEGKCTSGTCKSKFTGGVSSCSCQ